MAEKRARASTQPDSHVQPHRRRFLLFASLIALACILAFGPILVNDFVSMDDNLTIAQNPRLNPPTLDSLTYYWKNPELKLYIPLTYTLWWVLASISNAPALFHAANLLLHILTSLVVFALIVRLIHHLPAALLGASLFALHPVQVESVAWASGLKDVLCGLLTWTAIWQYCVFASTPPPRPKRHYVFATLAFALAMLSKPTAVVAPLLVFVIDALIIRRPIRTILLSAGPWLILAIPCMIWTALIQAPTALTPHVHPALRPLIASDALAFYIYKLIWPATLIMDHGRRPDTVLTTHHAYYTWLIPLAMVALIALVARRSKDRGILLAAAAIFVIGLSPVLGLQPFDFQYYSTVAEHYLYLAMVGPALLFALLMRRPAFRVAGIAALVLLAARTHLQTYHWRNSTALFTHTLQHNPNSAFALNSMAAECVNTGHYDQALRYAQRYVDLRPNEMRPHATLAGVLSRLNQAPEAIAELQKAIQINPDDAALHANLAGLLAMTGDAQGARHHAFRALQLDHDEPQAHFNLGTLYYNEKQYEDAASELAEVVRIKPNDPRAHDYLGLALTELGKLDDAAQHFTRALELNPNDVQAKEGLEFIRQKRR